MRESEAINIHRHSQKAIHLMFAQKSIIEELALVHAEEHCLDI